MLKINERQAQVETALMDMVLPNGIRIRAWAETDFPAIEQLSTAEGWATLKNRADEAILERKFADEAR